MSTYGYLIHHGIKGQKWGIRRYQNEDGSYTEEGKIRYGMNNYSKENRSKLYTDTGRLGAYKRFKDAKSTIENTTSGLSDFEKEEKAYEILKEGNKTDALRSYYAYKSQVEYGKQAMQNISGLASFMTFGIGSFQSSSGLGDYYKNKYMEATKEFIKELELQDKINDAKSRNNYLENIKKDYTKLEGKDGSTIYVNPDRINAPEVKKYLNSIKK